MNMTEAQKLGVIDFLQMIYNGHPEYTLIAVKAPLEETIEGFIAVCQTRQTRRRFDVKIDKMEDVSVNQVNFHKQANIAVRDAQKHDEIAPAIPFIEIKGSPWTVIMRSIFYGNDEIFDVPEEAQALSIKLATKAIYLIEEDTSAAMGYELWDKGERLEYFAEACEDDFHFESKLREKPNINFNPWDDEDLDDEDDEDQEYNCNDEPRVQFVDAFFQELGIYLPACYPVDYHGKATLAVEKSSKDMIQRVDCLSMNITLTA